MPSDPRESAARRVEELFHRAWGLDAVERDSFLEQACQGDPTLEKTVRRLLAACTEVDQTPEWNNSALQFEAKAAAASERGESELGRYRLQESIGSGGMGTVYRAIRADDEFSKQVAVKIVHLVGTDESLARRFRRERQIQTRLEHVNIARLLDGGSTPDGRPFLVMEFVEGVPIDRYVLERKLSVRDVLVLFR